MTCTVVWQEMKTGQIPPTYTGWGHRICLPTSVRAADPTPGSGGSPGGGNGNPLQYSQLGNPMDRGAWRAGVNKTAKSWTRLSTHTQTLALITKHFIIIQNTVISKKAIRGEGQKKNGISLSSSCLLQIHFSDPASPKGMKNRIKRKRKRAEIPSNFS